MKMNFTAKIATNGKKGGGGVGGGGLGKEIEKSRKLKFSCDCIHTVATSRR